MDGGQELARFKWILVTGLVFLLSAYMSYQEFKYAMWGVSADAEVTRTFETSGTRRRGRRKQYLAVEYTFIDNERRFRSERDDVPLDWSLSDGDIKIQYLPGVDDSSRLAGHSNNTYVLIFFGSLGLLGFFGYKLYRLADDDPADRKRPRRK